MNKTEVINLVAARTELSKTDINKSLTAAFDVIMDAVAEGRKVSVMGFGSFEPRERSARSGFNPKTGEPISIPEKRVPVFTAGSRFKETVAY